MLGRVATKQFPALGSVAFSCAYVIAGLSRSDEEVKRAALAIADGVQFGVYPAFGCALFFAILLRNAVPGNGSGRAPLFYAMLVAVG